MSSPQRQAIIVVTPNSPHGLLPGAEQDAQDWSRFLPSVEGGAWKDYEICVLRDPSKAAVNIWLEHAKKRNIDYAILAFSGHGEVVKTSYSQETRIYVSKSDYFTEKTFTADAQRELVILDACRELRVEKSLEKIAAANVLAEAFSSRAEDRLRLAREYYDKAINENPVGRTFVYSCSVNETASDDPSFSRVFVGEGVELATSHPTRSVISAKSVFDRSKSLIVENFKQKQTPVYDGGRRITHLPFSVSI